MMEESDTAELVEESLVLPTREIQNLFYANSDRLINQIEKETSIYIAGREGNLILRGAREEIVKGKRIITNIIS